MRKSTLVLVLAFSIVAVSTVVADPEAVAGPNEAAPKETSQYAFIVGTWDCKTRFMNAKGEYTEGRAVWTGFWILDGWAVQDIWISDQPDGSKFHGTNIRSFDPKTQKWDNRWLPQGSLQWKQFESEQHGDTMVMTGGGGSDARGEFIDRNTFHDIGENSWKWRKDRSYDGGKTWLEGVGFIEATRSKPR